LEAELNAKRTCGPFLTSEKFYRRTRKGVNRFSRSAILALMESKRPAEAGRSFTGLVLGLRRLANRPDQPAGRLDRFLGLPPRPVLLNLSPHTQRHSTLCCHYANRAGRTLQCLGDFGHAFLIVRHRLQCATRETHYRGQAHACLSILTGGEPPSLDLLVFQLGGTAPDLENTD